jgi:subtilisin family serine protease
LSIQPVAATINRILAVPKLVAPRIVGAKATAPMRPSVRGRAVKGPKTARSVAAAIARDIEDSMALVHTQNDRLGLLFHDTSESAVGMVAPRIDEPIILVTDTIVVENARKSEINWLRDKYGMEVLREGLQGKVLLKSQEGGEKGNTLVFEAAKAVFERGVVAAAHPDFLRLLTKVKPSAAPRHPMWNHDNPGNPGIASADVAASAAWTITRGSAAVRVAVLDEGVDTEHAGLQTGVVDQKDFVDGNAHARPDGNDAHGTACAGIIASRDATYPGLAPECSLVAVRIAKGDGTGSWIFDDFATADAIDWAWQEGKADVLSNSWGGGPAVDVVSRAIERARTKGRQGRGAVVVVAAGNDNGAINFPATLDGVIAVGASNPWDERKSPASSDGENWWGSNFGKALSLVAPGVGIATTDISGKAGYCPDDFTLTFNGTSAAAPHVAAVAALIISIMPRLNEEKIRAMINHSADPWTRAGSWDRFVGFGRLNAFSALRLARRGE